MYFDVIVIGAGAAGMMCAATASKRGRKVLLLDHAKKLAERLRIPGEKRCQLTHLASQAKYYVSHQPGFCQPALDQFSPKDFLSIVDRYHIAYVEKDDGSVVCEGFSSQVAEMLAEECAKARVDRRMGMVVEQVQKLDCFQVKTPQGVFESASLVVATGGLAVPVIGASGLGYQLAEQFGIPVIPVRPGLVPLLFDPEHISALARASGTSINVNIAVGDVCFSEVLSFTPKGLTGPAILQASLHWLPGMPLDIDLMPGVDLTALLEDKQFAQQPLSVALASTGWPKLMAEAWAAYIGVKGKVKGMSAEKRQLLLEKTHAWKVEPIGMHDYIKAQVANGGVDTRAIMAESMMVKAIPGLFFAGEVLDVTGQLGGFNLQWAWSSGYVAGLHC